MKKLLSLFILLCFSVSIFAEGKDVLSVIMKDGTSVYFLLAEKPLITFQDDNVKIVSETDEVMMKRTLVERFEFVADMPTSIDDVEEEALRGQFELTGNAVVVNGLADGCKVGLYSINGQAVMSAVAGENGCAILSLEALPAGIYLVNYNDTTIKFIKR